MKRILLVTSVLLSGVVSAHADTATYTSTSGRGAYSEMMEVGQVCDQRLGAVQNGEATSPAYKKCMLAGGWRYQSTTREHTWIDPDTGDTCHDILGGLGSSCGNF